MPRLYNEDQLRVEYENTIQQQPDADALMERVCGVLTAIVRLARCTSASVGESPKWILISRNMAGTRRDLHQHLKGKKLYSTLYRFYTEMLHNLTTALKESAAGPQMLHLRSLRNSLSKEGESGNLQTIPTKDPKSL
jgi:hypothetical protein